MNRMKVQKKLEDYQKLIKPDDNERAFHLAICYIHLENYPEAQFQFERSTLAMFKSPKLWKITSQPNWLTDICMLSGRIDLFHEVLRELELYKQLDKGDSPVALYAYGLMELLVSSGWDMYLSIKGLMERPKYKYPFSLGQILKAIVEKNQNNLDEGMKNLLAAHERMAKYGGLRESAEGFLCLPAMSLSYAAMKHNFKIEIENDYLSLGYLKFLLGIIS
jgi:hypothetical protein